MCHRQDELSLLPTCKGWGKKGQTKSLSLSTNNLEGFDDDRQQFCTVSMCWTAIAGRTEEFLHGEKKVHNYIIGSPTWRFCSGNVPATKVIGSRMVGDACKQQNKLGG